MMTFAVMEDGGLTVAKKDDTKARILAIERMFQIIRKLDLEYDIQVDRKTVYQDIAVLTHFMNICTSGHGQTHFYQLVYLDDLLEE